MPSGEPPSIEETLAEVAEVLEADLREIFGHEDATVRLEQGTGHRLIAEGEAGSFEVTWPPADELTGAEGRFGAHAKIAFEFLLASRTPAQFFDGYRPQNDERRERTFDILEEYIDDSLRANPYYTPLVTVRRGPAMLVYGDDEYTIVAEDGNYTGSGILEWKVKRLVAFAITDADEAIFDGAEPDDLGPPSGG